MLQHVVDLCKHLSETQKNHGWNNPLHIPQNPLMKHHAKSSDFCKLPVFFWVPELMYPKFIDSAPCPKCNGKAVMCGWNPKGPRLVASPLPYWIITKNHVCNSCGAKFLGYEPESIKKMPKCIQAEFPAVLNYDIMFDRTWFEVVKRQFSKGQSFADLKKLLNEMASLQYWRKVSQFYESEIKEKKHFHKSGPVITPFPPPGSKKCDDVYPLHIPSAKALKTLWLEDARKAKPLIVKALTDIKGEILRGDETFKVAKIPHERSTRAYEGNVDEKPSLVTTTF